MIRRISATLVVAGLLGTVAVAAPAAAATGSGTGTVYVVHGIPGATVDVYVNGSRTLTGFAPGTVAGPLTLPTATYSVAVYPTGANPASAQPLITASVPLPAGADASLVAHLSVSGAPVLTAYVNDLSPAAVGDGRLIVRHDAAAPAVDVLAGGKPVFTNLTNPNEAKADVPAGTYTASVVAAGTTGPAVIGPAAVPVVAGTATIVYAVGSPAAGGTASTLGVVTQQIPLGAAPAGGTTTTAPPVATPTPPAAAPQLPFTGAGHPWRDVTGGVSLLALGSLMAWGARRRRSGTA